MKNLAQIKKETKKADQVCNPNQVKGGGCSCDEKRKANKRGRGNGWE